jgi:hypothetical protein
VALKQTNPVGVQDVISGMTSRRRSWIRAVIGEFYLEWISRCVASVFVPRPWYVCQDVLDPAHYKQHPQYRAEEVFPGGIVGNAIS